MHRMQAQSTTPHGQPVEIARGVRRIIAPNPSPMTQRGTNTYILGESELVVIDPGPDIAAHLAAILGAVGAGQRIVSILVTHAHQDHSALAPRLSVQSGAPVLAFGDATAGRSARMSALRNPLGGGEGADIAFTPDRRLADGDAVALDDGWITAVHTPGHMGNHLCFQWRDVVFSGDHVMGWASTLISPPDGDMTDYMRSLERLAALKSGLLLPGHGAPVPDPTPRIAELRAHREARAAQILGALADGPNDIAGLAARIYSDTPPAMLPAARRNVLAHLIDLEARGLVVVTPPVGPEAFFALRSEEQNAM
jgi:glyoxylase-like metal-dependent hydrolase (beta-lactamase superfamily II)